MGNLVYYEIENAKKYINKIKKILNDKRISEIGDESMMRNMYMRNFYVIKDNKKYGGAIGLIFDKNCKPLRGGVKFFTIESEVENELYKEYDFLLKGLQEITEGKVEITCLKL